MLSFLSPDNKVWLWQFQTYTMNYHGTFPWKLHDAFNVLLMKGLSTTHSPTSERPSPYCHHALCKTDTRKLKLRIWELRCLVNIKIMMLPTSSFVGLGYFGCTLGSPSASSLITPFTWGELLWLLLAAEPLVAFICPSPPLLNKN